MPDTKVTGSAGVDSKTRGGSLFRGRADTSSSKDKPKDGPKLDRTESLRSTLQVYLPNGEFRAVKYGEASDVKVGIYIIVYVSVAVMLHCTSKSQAYPW